MGSLKKMPFSLDDLHFVPAQVSKIPLNTNEEVNIKAVIGPEAKKPLTSFLSNNVQWNELWSSIQKCEIGSGKSCLEVKSWIKLRRRYCSAGRDLKLHQKILVVQYSTGRVRITDEILKKSSAIEIRFGQGAFPGWESLLPAEKVPSELAKLMELKEGEALLTPAHHPDIRNQEELKEKVRWLKELTGGIPVGAKIGCGNVENDVEILANAGVDFISLDGFGGGTGATEFFVRENVGIPIVAALPRADTHLKKIGQRNKISLIAGGGLRTSADFAKCLALGADAVYIGTSALIAINCQQYRICHTGHCPTGVTTNDPILVQRLDVDEGVRKLTNFINVSNQEVAKFTENRWKG